MSQPKTQLQTFKSWAGQASDISYYLNSHHIDFHEWCMDGRALPVRIYSIYVSVLYLSFETHRFVLRVMLALESQLLWVLNIHVKIL